jgi:hypothetical protein
MQDAIWMTSWLLRTVTAFKTMRQFISHWCQVCSHTRLMSKTRGNIQMLLTNSQQTWLGSLHENKNESLQVCGNAFVVPETWSTDSCCSVFCSCGLFFWVSILTPASNQTSLRSRLSDAYLESNLCRRRRLYSFISSRFTKRELKAVIMPCLFLNDWFTYTYTLPALHKGVYCTHSYVRMYVVIWWSVLWISFFLLKTVKLYFIYRIFSVLLHFKAWSTF